MSKSPCHAARPRADENRAQLGCRFKCHRSPHRCGLGSTRSSDESCARGIIPQDSAPATDALQECRARPSLRLIRAFDGATVSQAGQPARSPECLGKRAAAIRTSVRLQMLNVTPYLKRRIKRSRCRALRVMLLLILQTKRRPRHSFQALRLNWFAAVDAQAVFARHNTL